MFSPHTRGCSALAFELRRAFSVFPAYAGMFRPSPGISRVSRCFPRIRGDVPRGWQNTNQKSQFSPHTRGCSVSSGTPARYAAVFPAYAGMFRLFDLLKTGSGEFSPHTRGCSAGADRQNPLQQVFPAYAGMFRIKKDGANQWPGFPRIRGDVPHFLTFFLSDQWFSPHTRGCSAVAGRFADDTHVFPAYAGMFRYGSPHKLAWRRFPRIRGDVPVPLGTQHRKRAFSPHTRGCSIAQLGRDQKLTVFPAYARMFLRTANQHLKPRKFSPHTRGCS